MAGWCRRRDCGYWRPACSSSRRALVDGVTSANHRRDDGDVMWSLSPAATHDLASPAALPITHNICCYAPVISGMLEQRDPSVCLSAGAAAYAIGTLAACSLTMHRRPTEMCRLRTRPRTDVDPPRFLDRTAIGGGHIVSSRCPRGDNLLGLEITAQLNRLIGSLHRD